ncbi:MAG TPA: hypothetical protein V6C76_00855 [Drouetiella sp.]
MSRNLLKIKSFLILGATALTTLSQSAFARDIDFSQDTTPITHSEQSLVSSDQILDIATSTSSALRMEGEQSMRFNNIDRAVLVLSKSVEMSPSDMDGRILYAEALEKKLGRQNTQDPQLKNLCVKQWLYIAKKAEYPDQKAQGLKHLSSLTGTKPRMLETEDRFLARVLLPEDNSTQVANSKAVAKTE